MEYVGKVSVLQHDPSDQQQNQNDVDGSASAPAVVGAAASAWTTSAATALSIKPPKEGGEDAIQQKEKVEAEPQQQHEEEAHVSNAAGLPGLASPTLSPAAGQGQSVGPEDSLTWMEEAVEPGSSKTTTSEDAELTSLSELERVVEHEPP